MFSKSPCKVFAKGPHLIHHCTIAIFFEKLLDVSSCKLNCDVSKTAICLRGGIVDCLYGIWKCRTIPRIPSELLESSLRKTLYSNHTVYLADGVNLDVEKHVCTRSVGVIEAVEELEQGFDNIRIVIFELNDSFVSFLFV